MKKELVLFDLDGTLLPMDIAEFIHYYFRYLTKYMEPHGYDPASLKEWFWKGTGAMMQNDGSMTNETLFWNVFEKLAQKDVKKDYEIFDQFYRTEFGKIKEMCKPNPVMKEVVDVLKEKGYRLAIATNPLFPKVATAQRIEWAGFDLSTFELFSTYEDYSYCKPNPNYYKEVLQKLNVEGKDVLMIGNDAVEDLAAKQLGMEVYLVTDCLLHEEGIDYQKELHGTSQELLEWVKKEC